MLLVGEGVVDEQSWKTLLPQSRLTHAPKLSDCVKYSFDLVVVQRTSPADDITDVHSLLLGGSQCRVLHEGLVVMARVSPESVEWLTNLSLVTRSAAAARKHRPVRVIEFEHSRCRLIHCVSAVCDNQLPERRSSCSSGNHHPSGCSRSFIQSITQVTT